jgi:hypothetical protein
VLVRRYTQLSSAARGSTSTALPCMPGIQALHHGCPLPFCSRCKTRRTGQNNFYMHSAAQAYKWVHAHWVFVPC